MLKIKELREGMRKVDIEGKVVEVGQAREVHSRYGDQTFRVADAVISDETGTVKLTLWNEQIGQVKVNDSVRIENGYTGSFRGELQLNVGKYGKLTVL